MANKVILHACAGAGISIADKAARVLLENVDARKGKADLIFTALDTSEANFKDTVALKDICELEKINSTNLKDNVLDGSGGVRAHDVTSIVAGVKSYLDKGKYLTKEKGVLHIILASASGGSGNIIATTLLDNLLSKEIPAIILLIGDASSAKSAENTLKVFMTIVGMSKKYERIVSMKYFLNDYSNKTVKEAQFENDGSIVTMIDLFTIFNGNVKDIDYQDLINIINPKAKDFNIPKGVYNLKATISAEDDRTFPETIQPVMERVIIQDYTKYRPLDIAHSKVGTVEDIPLSESIAMAYGSSNMFLTLTAGGLEQEMRNLQEKQDSIMNKLAKIKDEVNLDVEANADENGIVL